MLTCDTFGVSLQFIHALPSLLSCITTSAKQEQREHLSPLALFKLITAHLAGLAEQAQ